MSSMIPQPPPSIRLGGGPGGPGGPGPAGPGAGKPGGDGPDSEQVKTLIGQAIDALRQAEDLEGDDGDKAMLAKCVADLRGFIGNQQKMLDTAMGAGPGVKIMRKNAPGGGGAPAGPGMGM
jgi:hypothetical protein